jgi:hypothetical protein
MIWLYPALGQVTSAQFNTTRDFFCFAQRADVCGILQWVDFIYLWESDCDTI